MDELRQWLQEHTQFELARRIGVTQGAISQWLTKGSVPVHRVLAVYRATGIPPEKLRPDVYCIDLDAVT